MTRWARTAAALAIVVAALPAGRATAGPTLSPTLHVKSSCVFYWDHGDPVYEYDFLASGEGYAPRNSVSTQSRETYTPWPFPPLAFQPGTVLVDSFGRLGLTGAGSGFNPRYGITTSMKYDLITYDDLDGDLIVDPGETLAKDSATNASCPFPATVTLTPSSSTGFIGTYHTVTATVLTARGQPAPGVSVLFAATNYYGVTRGSCAVNSAGTCQFSYFGPYGGIQDQIEGCADSNFDGVRGVGEPCGFATRLWLYYA
jgi:hypothetical protein